MQIVLEPQKCARGKHLRISLVVAEWDKNRRAFAITVMFHETRDRMDNKPLGTVLYARNQETAAKMLQEYALLYPVREKTIVDIPDPEEEGRYFSCAGGTYPQNVEHEARLRWSDR